MQILRHYPFSILTVLAIWYLSFFTPPHTQLEEINNFDKLVHVCMYGGLSSIIWIEYLIQHKQIKSFPLIMGSILFPILMSGCIEILQSCCTDNRSGDWIDFIANCTGVCLASLAGHYIYRPFIQKKYHSGLLTPSHKKTRRRVLSQQPASIKYIILKIESYRFYLKSFKSSCNLWRVK